MIRVVVAAASSSARAGLETVLGRDPTLQVVAAVPPGSGLTVTLDSGPPDVIVLEIASDPAAALTVELRNAVVDGTPERAPAVVLLADGASAPATAAALRAGARAVLPWDASPDEILAAVHAAAAGLVALSGEVAADLVRDLGPAPGGTDAGPGDGAEAGATPSLSPREREVLAMMAEGLGNKSIARRLGISEHTVKTHVAGLFAKLGASSRTEAVATGIRGGLVVL